MKSWISLDVNTSNNFLISGFDSSPARTAMMLTYGDSLSSREIASSIGFKPLSILTLPSITV